MYKILYPQQFYFYTKQLRRYQQNTIIRTAQNIGLNFVLNAYQITTQIQQLNKKIQIQMCLQKVKVSFNKLQNQPIIGEIKIQEDLDLLISSQVQAIPNINPSLCKTESKSMADTQKSSQESESPKDKNWSQKQQDILFEKYEEYGPKWSFFATIIPNKTQNTIKNRFYGAIRKLLRRINSVGKKQKKLKKMISYQSIMRPLEAAELKWDLYEGFREENLQIKHMIVRCSKKCPQSLPVQESLELIAKIHKFNLMTRCFSLKKTKKQINQKKKQQEIKLKLEQEQHSVHQKISQNRQNNHYVNQLQHHLDLNVLLNEDSIEQLYNKYHPCIAENYAQRKQHLSENSPINLDYVEGILMEIEDSQINKYLIVQ